MPYLLDLTDSDHTLRLPTSFDTSSFKGRFAARFDYRYQGLAVVCQETAPDTWSVSEYPGVTIPVGGGDYATTENDINEADYVFYGGSEWNYDNEALHTALDAAGYTHTPL